MQEHTAKVFTYITCNNLNKLPDELKRAGRVNKVIQIPVLTSEESLSIRDSIHNYILKDYIIHSKLTNNVTNQGFQTGAEVQHHCINFIKEAVLNGSCIKKDN